MARPIHKRIIQNTPEYSHFFTDGIASGNMVTLTTDEYETIRLLDKINLTQEEAAKEMGVSRATITSIYKRAREKIAGLIVDGRELFIQGGSFTLKEKTRTYSREIEISDKGDGIMRVAVTYCDGMIFQHFGRTEEFKIYDIVDGVIKESKVIGTNGQGHGALASFLSSLGVDTLICGGIGGGAQMAISSMGIELYGGISGEADEAVKALLDEKIQRITDATCNHHHGEEHNCSNGGCNGHCHH